MQWKYGQDTTKPVLTAIEHINSMHHCADIPKFPDTAILFFMHSGVDYLAQKNHCPLLMEKLPRFLQGCPVYSLSERICFLDGGRGAPQAADTIETLSALGVKKILSVGMFGAFDTRFDVGDIIVPPKAFSEEGTSLHYYESIEYIKPDENIRDIALSLSKGSSYPIVSTDAVYRQTFYKEQLWREKGAVGVDMETSAIFSVSRFLKLKAAAMLISSDIHPENEHSPKWEWRITKEMRCNLFEKAQLIAEAMQ